MIYNAMQRSGFNPIGAELRFTDAADIADYAKQAVAELGAAGVINGIDDTHFEEMAKHANRNGRFSNAFVALNEQDIVEIFKNCL